MKNKANYFVTLLFSFFFIIIHHPLFGQEKINLFAGVGMVELLHAGVRYSFPQTQLGFSVGFMSNPDDRLTSFSGDALFHIGGSSKLSARRPWYLKVGITNQKIEFYSYRISNTYFNPRIGREINLSKKFGLQLDAGVSFDMSSRRGPTPTWDVGIPFIPSFGTALFYRL